MPFHEWGWERCWGVSANSQVEEDCPDSDHTEIIVGALLVAGGDPSELLQAIDELLNPSPQLVKLLAEWTTPLILFVRDGDTDAVLAQPLTNLPAAIGFIACYAPWTQARPTALVSFDGSLFHQLLECLAFVALTRLQNKGDWLALAFGTHV
jgi:hypothetical protein